jgi:hypothetical protein
MTKITPTDATSLKKWDRALDFTIDQMISRTSGVAQYVQKLREQHPSLSDHELARLIVSRKCLKSGLIGFATGLPGLALLPATIPTDVIANWQVQITMVVAVACVHGHTANTTDLKTDIYLVLAGDAAKEVLKRVGITAACDVTYKLVNKYITREVMRQIWKVLSRRIITKAGEKSITSLTRLVPGVGGLVGFAFDWAATRTVGQFALKYYGGEEIPEPKTQSTWGGRSQFAYTGSIKDGIFLEYGREGRYSCEISREQCRALLKHFRGRTVPIGTSRTQPPEGSLGEWLQRHVTRTAIASYVGPILVSEGYAERPSQSEIMFGRGRHRAVRPERRS